MEVDAVAGAHSAPPVAMGALRPGLDLDVLESVDISLHDVRSEAGRIDRLTIHAHRVRLEGGMVASLVAGPVELEGEVDQATLDEWLEAHDAPVAVTLDGTDRATVQVLGRRVSAVVSAEIAEDGRSVSVPVHGVRWAGLPVPLVHRFVTPRRFEVPDLPRDLRLTGLSSAPGVVRATGVVDRFREPILVES